MLKNSIGNKTLLLVIIACVAFMFCMLVQVMPCQDDLYYLTAPFADGGIKNLLPSATFWRPFDAIWGMMITNVHSYFPLLNHISVFIGYLLVAFMFVLLLRELKISSYAKHIGLSFLLVSPAVISTLLNIDSLNQAYVTFWGLVSLYFYLSEKKYKKYFLWIFFAYIATLCKENGITYFVIPPLLAWAFKKVEDRTVYKDVAVGLVFAIGYLLLRWMLLQDSALVSTGEGRYSISLSHVFVNFAMLVSWIWLPMDYTSILIAERRNWILAIILFLLSIPFLIRVFGASPRKFTTRKVFGVIVACLCAGSINFLTTLGPMHTFSVLPFAALLVAVFLDEKVHKQNLVTALFLLYAVCSMVVFYRHWDLTMETANRGIRMAENVIRRLEGQQHPQKVFSITLKTSEIPYSTFKMPVSDVFYHGKEVQWLTDYAWPKTIKFKEIKDTEKYKVPQLIDSIRAANSFDQIWIDHEDSVRIIWLNPL